MTSPLGRAVGAAALLFSVFSMVACDSARSTSQRVPLDGGYALLRVDTPGENGATVRVDIEDARAGERYYLLREREDAPAHIGWFDPAPYATGAEHCATGIYDCCCDLAGGAGEFVEVREAIADGPLTLTADAACGFDHTCTTFVAVLASRPDVPRRMTVTVTTYREPNASRPTLYVVR